jgi:ribulose-5-phosphate 4-epimerase/fuculose-1-phosphate aldolase
VASKQFLINPFGLHYSEVTASNLVKVECWGEVLDGSPHRSTRPASRCTARHPRGVDGAHCVMHTHTTAGVAVASLASGLSQSNFYSAQLHDMVATTTSRASPSTPKKARACWRPSAASPAVILRNHGLLSWGQTLPLAFAVLWTLQRACEIQLATQSMGAPLPVPEALPRKCTRDALQFDPPRRWPGRVRCAGAADRPARQRSYKN